MITVGGAMAHRKRLIKHQAPGSQINTFIFSNCNKGRIALDMKIEPRETEQILVPPT